MKAPTTERNGTERNGTSDYLTSQQFENFCKVKNRDNVTVGELAIIDRIKESGISDEKIEEFAKKIYNNAIKHRTDFSTLFGLIELTSSKKCDTTNNRSVDLSTNSITKIYDEFLNSFSDWKKEVKYNQAEDKLLNSYSSKENS